MKGSREFLLLSIHQVIAGHRGLLFPSAAKALVKGPGISRPEVKTREEALDLARVRARRLDGGRGITFIQRLDKPATVRRAAVRSTNG